MGDESSFHGRAVLVTGAASGIGLAISKELAARGMRVMLADIDEDGLSRALPDVPGAHAVVLDTRDRAAWQAALDETERECGPLAVIVGNAGVAGSRLSLAETSVDAWEWSRSINLDACFHALNLGLPRLARADGPTHFVATASLGALLVHPGNGVYSAAKAGVVALCEAARAETRQTDTRISVLLPGRVRTALVEKNAARAPRGVAIGEREPELEQAMRESLDPGEVGRLVADALGTDRFWLFTHPELMGAVRDRAEEMAAAMRG